MNTQQPSHTPSRQSPRALRVIACVTMLIALFPIGGGIYALAGSTAPTHVLALPELMGPARVAAGDFVVTDVFVSADRVGHIDSSKQVDDDFVVAVRGDPRLLLYVPSSSDLGAAIRSYEPSTALPPNAQQRGAVERAWHIEGRIHDIGDDPRMTSTLPMDLVRQDAAARFGGQVPAELRVLEVGADRASLYFVGIAPIACCGLPFLLLGAFALMRASRLARAAPPAGAREQHR